MKTSDALGHMFSARGANYDKDSRLHIAGGSFAVFGHMPDADGIVARALRIRRFQTLIELFAFGI